MGVARSDTRDRDRGDVEALGDSRDTRDARLPSLVTRDARVPSVWANKRAGMLPLQLRGRALAPWHLPALLVAPACCVVALHAAVGVCRRQ